MGTESFSGAKRPGRGVDHPPLSSVEVKERVDLYINSASGTSWPVLGWTLTFMVASTVILCSLLLGSTSSGTYRVSDINYSWSSIRCTAEMFNVHFKCEVATGYLLSRFLNRTQVWTSFEAFCCLLLSSVAYPGIFFGGWGGGGGGSTNSVEDRGQRERGSGCGSPLLRGSGGRCNLVLFHFW
jgi:hypothetical protein